MLLHVRKGPTSFTDIRTISRQAYPTFRAACEALGLLGDDREDAAQWALPFQLRQLFVTLLLFCDVTNPIKLFEEHASPMSEDIEHRLNLGPSKTSNSSLHSYVTSCLLIEHDKLLRDSGYCLSHF